ncbi:hypothetical protein P691DRAFT_25584 [Macrolepiota fuliginosa MF-IS2]|uniref:Uncharacterized protein n=1 Tax=Macrolepiota fuliginosa MF-IS2 TaxID=1400762 RepID=A0A9P5XQ07_9AGAR|nr:hypothetical protein P691DRAFT_25584 [Macrolepiota fuliginosa MF-IS2]
MGPRMNEFKLFNDFPKLVQRRVFNIAFEAGETDYAAVQLSLVSRGVNHWIKPLIYRQLIFHFQATATFQRTISLLQTILTTSNLELCTRYTRFLFVGSYHHGNTSILSLFLHCTNLEHLGWWFIPKQEKELQELLTTQQHHCLRKLSISAGALPLRDPHLFSTQVFQNLTHLDIGVAGRLVSLSSGARQFGRRIPWSDLHKLEHLIHLHLDLGLVYRASDPDEVAPEIEEVVGDMLDSAPPKLRYAALLFPFEFLFEAIKSSDVENRRVYEDFVKGSLDRRVVVGTSAGIFEYQEEKVQEKMKEKAEKKSRGSFPDEEDEEDEDEELLTQEQAERLTTFGKWMVPSPRGERLYRVCETRGERRADFWGEVEETVERRNKELYPDEPSDSQQIIPV